MRSKCVRWVENSFDLCYYNRQKNGRTVYGMEAYKQEFIEFMLA